jgi:hypothetical protein
MLSSSRIADRRRCVVTAAALAAAVPAMIAGLVSPASAAAVSPATATVAGRDPSVCKWLPVPATIWIGDPAARYAMIGGEYNRPGNRGVAYKLTGQFAHSTTMSFTSYNDLEDLISPAYQAQDVRMTPDPGSVNPFIPGNLVEARHRSYTAWLWPDSVRVPKGLTNVVLYPTTAADPRDKLARWVVALRQYHLQPGFSAPSGYPVVHAVSAANPDMQVPCPLHRRGSIFREAQNYFAHIRHYGVKAGGPPPEPTSGNKIYFTRAPVEFGVGVEGFPVGGSANYLVARLPSSEITVVRQRLPTYFNNNLVTPTTVMFDWDTYWNSQTFIGWPALPKNSVNQDDGIFTPEGNFVTVVLPSDPRLRPAQSRQVRAAAARLGYNVLQMPGKIVSTNPVARTLPKGVLIVRQQRPSATYCCAATNVPSWVDPNNPLTAHHNYKDWPNQTSPKFFAKFSSNRRNMGRYWVGGVKYTFEEFMRKFGG